MIVPQGPPQWGRMAPVDPDDDTIYRFVVLHFRSDPERNQRRQVAVAAFDNGEEGMAELERLAVELAQRKEAGLAEDVEWMSSFAEEPGYRGRMRRMRQGMD